MPKGLHALAIQVAKNRGQSLNAFLNEATERHLQPPTELGPPMWLDDYRERASVSESNLQILRRVIDDQEPIIICGDRHSGKTTLLSVIMRERLTSATGPMSAMLWQRTPQINDPKPLLSIVVSPMQIQNGLGRFEETIKPRAIFVDDLWPSAVPDVIRGFNHGVTGAVSISGSIEDGLTMLHPVSRLCGVEMREGRITQVIQRP